MATFDVNLLGKLVRLSTNFGAKIGLPASGDANVSCCAFSNYFRITVFSNQVYEDGKTVLIMYLFV